MAAVLATSVLVTDMVMLMAGSRLIWYQNYQFCCSKDLEFATPGHGEKAYPWIQLNLESTLISNLWYFGADYPG